MCRNWIVECQPLGLPQSSIVPMALLVADFLNASKQREKEQISKDRVVISPQNNFAALESWWRKSDRQCIIFSSAGFGKGPLHSRGGSTADSERKLKKEKESEREQEYFNKGRNSGGSVWTRRGMLCAWQNKCRGGEENINSAGSERTGITVWD